VYEKLSFMNQIKKENGGYYLKKTKTEIKGKKRVYK